MALPEKTPAELTIRGPGAWTPKRIVRLQGAGSRLALEACYWLIARLLVVVCLIFTTTCFFAVRSRAAV